MDYQLYLIAMFWKIVEIFFGYNLDEGNFDPWILATWIWWMVVGYTFVRARFHRPEIIPRMFSWKYMVYFVVGCPLLAMGMFAVGSMADIGWITPNIPPSSVLGGTFGGFIFGMGMAFAFGGCPIIALSQVGAGKMHALIGVIFLGYIPAYYTFEVWTGAVNGLIWFRKLVIIEGTLSDLLLQIPAFHDLAGWLAEMFAQNHGEATAYTAEGVKYINYSLKPLSWTLDRFFLRPMFMAFFMFAWVMIVFFHNFFLKPLNWLQERLLGHSPRGVKGQWDVQFYSYSKRVWKTAVENYEKEMTQLAQLEYKKTSNAKKPSRKKVVRKQTNKPDGSYFYQGYQFEEKREISREPDKSQQNQVDAPKTNRGDPNNECLECHCTKMFCKFYELVAMPFVKFFAQF